MAESMWGEWLPKMIAEMNAVDPTPEEREVLQRANEIKSAHIQRIETVRQKFFAPKGEQ